LVQFSDKTKETTKEKSLKRYLSKEFWVSREEQEDEEFQSKTSFSSIPRYLFNYTNKKNADYIITIKWLSKQLGTTILFDNTDLRIKPQDKIALVWKNWAGKSTFLKILLDPILADKGEIEILKDLKIWYLSQDLFRESREKTVLEEMMTTFPEVTKRVERLDEIKVQEGK
jgi:ABC-type bacteriocin/lantibiotic exporter with double-glycine peptidase domain